MKDFEQLTDEEQTNVIMSISTKLDKQEMWYWMGLVHLLREQDKRIKKAIECIEYYATEDEDYSKIYNQEEQVLLKILKGSSNV